MKNISAALIAFGVLAKAVDDCPYALDVVFVQDLSYSYNNDLPNLKALLPLFKDQLDSDHPESKIALVSFVDHPIAPLGWAGFDHCVNIAKPLTDNSAEITLALNSYTAGGGYDWQEAQLQAVHHALRNDAVGWRPVGSVTSSGDPIHRVIVLVTDSIPHLAGDGAAEGLVPNDGDAVLDCGVEDYPTLAQLTEAFDVRDAVFVVLSANDPAVPAIDVAEVYDEIVDSTVGAAKGVVVSLSSDASDFLAAIGEAVSEIGARVCQPTTTEFPCEENHALEIVYAQDLSYSFSVGLPVIKATVPDAFRTVQAKYPFTKVSFASFTDKPIEPFGYATSMDYCYWLHQGLNDDMNAFDASLQSSFFRSGGDWKEAVMDTLFQIGTDPAVGFTPGAVDGAGRTLKRVVLAVTDGAPHFAGDGLPNGLTSHDGLPGLDCRHEDYPSSVQVAQALLGVGVEVAFGVPNSLVPTYAAIAAQWTGMGVPTRVIPVESLASGLEDLIESMTDPCGPTRRLQEDHHRATLLRQLSMLVPLPDIAMQEPVRLSARQMAIATGKRRLR
eukprot:Polyplicarium_translucidae@DN3381_c1_g2_i3.p1